MIAAANFLSYVVAGNGCLENLLGDMVGGQNILKKRNKMSTFQYQPEQTNHFPLGLLGIVFDN